MKNIRNTTRKTMCVYISCKELMIYLFLIPHDIHLKIIFGKIHHVIIHRRVIANQISIE